MGNFDNILVSIIYSLARVARLSSLQNEQRLLAK